MLWQTLGRKILSCLHACLTLVIWHCNSWVKGMILIPERTACTQLTRVNRKCPSCRTSTHTRICICWNVGCYRMSQEVKSRSECLHAVLEKGCLTVSVLPLRLPSPELCWCTEHHSTLLKMVLKQAAAEYGRTRKKMVDGRQTHSRLRQHCANGWNWWRWQSHRR